MTVVRTMASGRWVTTIRWQREFHCAWNWCRIRCKAIEKKIDEYNDKNLIGKKQKK